jgi:hypothetical protein
MSRSDSGSPGHCILARRLLPPWRTAGWVTTSHSKAVVGDVMADEGGGQQAEGATGTSAQRRSVMERGSSRQRRPRRRPRATRGGSARTSRRHQEPQHSAESDAVHAAARRVEAVIAHRRARAPVAAPAPAGLCPAGTGPPGTGQSLGPKPVGIEALQTIGLLFWARIQASLAGIQGWPSSLLACACGVGILRMRNTECR